MQIQGKIKENSKWVLLFLIGLLTIKFGLADYDYYWQARCGKYILTEGNFNSLTTLSWYNKDLGTYLDHEWLTNIIFYLFSLLGLKGIFFLKTFIISVVMFTSIKFVKHYNKDLNDVSYLLTVATVFLTSMLVFKVKAYTLSVVFLMYEIRLLEEYKKKIDENKKIYSILIRLLILIVLWNNMHSGSFPLFFGVAGLYYITELRDKKTLLIGLGSLVATGITPFGYKLIFFDILHNGNKVMKHLVKDWQAFDTKESQGIIAFGVLLILFICMIKTVDKKLFYYVLTFVLLFLTFQSLRQLIYVYPLVLYFIAKADISKVDININKVSVVASIIMLVGIIYISISTLNAKDYEEEYCIRRIPTELQQIIEEQGYQGLFTSDDGLLAYDGQPFMSGAYPLNSDKTITTCFLNSYANQTYIENIISNYGLTKFLIYKYNIENIPDMKYYTLLYDYLQSHNDKYECLYDSDIYCYYIER